LLAALYTGEGNLSVQEVTRPKVGEGEVLVRVEANSICGTDMRIASGAKSKGVSLPRILGHEVAGVIEEVGRGVTSLAVGDRVGIAPTMNCFSCEMCLAGVFNLCTSASVLGHEIDGGLAEFIVVARGAVTAGNLVVAPSGLSAEEVALAEPLSCVVHGQGIIGVKVDDVVLIIGGGAIGQLHAQLAKVSGARLVIVSEPVASRRLMAKELGADIVVDPISEDLKAIVSNATNGLGADVVIVCIGIPQLLNDAFDLARRRGKVNLFAGFPSGAMAQVDANLIHYKELSISGSSNSTISEYKQALRLISTGRVKVAPLVTHRFSLTMIDEALAAAASPEALKVVVLPFLENLPK
jgi:L-iditol 2-dehydrogenase